ncbi:FadR/GntR family transcriptional regulator [Frankia sp. Cr2]|uniref:FadR/GntR family transcriptional regulator n=1 Tax=Frankia sp. Cr2 TaxID=3073932 RepID=UPI002AD36A5A|nr:FCD domain-containing protein [Frankia sp. Cr2]
MNRRPADIDATGHVRVPKTAELVAAALRRQIIRGDLREGDGLPNEASLMARFDVSRPTLREAFRVLESEGLIGVRRGAHGGARVHVPNGDVAAHFVGLVLQHDNVTVADVLEARSVIEPPAARLLAARRRRRDIEALTAHLDSDEQRLAGPESLIPAHTDFHETMVELAGNHTLAVLTRMLRHLITGVTMAHRATLPSGSGAEFHEDELALRAHRRLVDLIAAGDATGAEVFWRRHLVETNQVVLEHFDEASVLDVLG